jgi:hypothetical protein
MNGGKVFSLTHRPHFTPQKHYSYMSEPQGLVRPEGLCKYSYKPKYFLEGEVSGITR